MDSHQKAIEKVNALCAELKVFGECGVQPFELFYCVTTELFHHHLQQLHCNSFIFYLLFLFFLQYP
jgi:hypothetical protein